MYSPQFISYVNLQLANLSRLFCRVFNTCLCVGMVGNRFYAVLGFILWALSFVIYKSLIDIIFTSFIETISVNYKLGRNYTLHVTFKINDKYRCNLIFFSNLLYRSNIRWIPNYLRIVCNCLRNSLCSIFHPIINLFRQLSDHRSSKICCVFFFN